MNNIRVADIDFIQQNINNIIRVPFVYSLTLDGIETIRRNCNLPDVWGLSDIALWFGQYDIIVMYHNHNRRQLEPVLLDYNRNRQQFVILQLPFECLKDHVNEWILNHVIEQGEHNEQDHFEVRVLNYYAGGDFNYRRNTFQVVLPIYNAVNQLYQQ